MCTEHYVPRPKSALCANTSLQRHDGEGYKKSIPELRSAHIFQMGAFGSQSQVKHAHLQLEYCIQELSALPAAYPDGSVCDR